MTELTKEQKKVARKEKFKKFFKENKCTIISALITGVGCIASYKLGFDSGKHKGKWETLEGPEVKLIADLTAYDAMDTMKSKMFELALTGNYASKFENSKTGEIKYLTYTVVFAEIPLLNSTGVTNVSSA